MPWLTSPRDSCSMSESDLFRNRFQNAKRAKPKNWRRPIRSCATLSKKTRGKFRKVSKSWRGSWRDKSSDLNCLTGPRLVSNLKDPSQESPRCRDENKRSIKGLDHSLAKALSLKQSPVNSKPKMGTSYQRSTQSKGSRTPPKSPKTISSSQAWNRPSFKKYRDSGTPK